MGGSGGVGGDDVPTPPSDPQPLIVPEWQVAKVGASNNPIGAVVDDGSFVQPTPGYLGLDWQPVVPGENGALIESFTDYIYAAATVTVPAGHRVFARGDTVVSFYTNNATRQPGDYYHSRKMRTPLGSVDGDNLVLVRALGRRNIPEVELWTTDGEVVFNTEDMTSPNFVVGDDSERYLGIATLITADDAPTDVRAIVVGDSNFEQTEIVYPSLQPQAVTQLGFLLRPAAAFDTADQQLPVTLRISSPSLDWDYDTVVEVSTVAVTARYRMTRRSGVDGSVQYYAVMPPTDPQAQSEFGLIMSLHGASVEASGQANSYSPKDWTYLIAPTNRRPFGFDWEEWGRLDAIEALDHAMSTLAIDPLRVHLTGHSMGGHGSWHVGAHFTDRFGVIGPSAGWISFETYGGPDHPDGVIGRARAASETLDFVENFADRSIYIIHGTADDNVPVSHAKQMEATLTPIVPELVYHEQVGARHWWDLDDTEPGADCVDWEPMIDVMQARMRDPLPLDFHWTSPGPFVNPQHSFVTVRAAQTPMDNIVVDAVSSGTQLTVTTTNVRGMTIDGSALETAGISDVDIDGTSYATSAGDITVGATTGKRPDQYGPLNQLFHKPFCFVWPDDGEATFRNYASFMLSWWSVIGNGQGCGVPLGGVAAVGDDYNLIYIGIPSAELDSAGALPLSWDTAGVTIGGQTLGDVAVAFLYPDGERLAGYFFATAGSEHLLFRYLPFSSRSGMPDYLLWAEDGLAATGFFDADWQFDATLSEGP